MLRYFDQYFFCMMHSIGRFNVEINRYKTCTIVFYLITSHGDSNTSCLLVNMIFANYNIMIFV